MAQGKPWMTVAIEKCVQSKWKNIKDVNKQGLYTSEICWMEEPSRKKSTVLWLEPWWTAWHFQHHTSSSTPVSRPLQLWQILNLTEENSWNSEIWKNASQIGML